MSEDKRAKCEIVEGVINRCWAMDQVIEDPYGRGTRYQGIKLLTLYKIDQSPVKFSRHIISVKSGEHAKKGIVLNYCPFCGEKLHHEFDESTHQPAKEDASPAPLTAAKEPRE